MIERWETITEAPRYKVSNLGGVYSLINNAPKKSFIDNKGYLRVQLYISPGKAITRKVHRLVATYFIGGSSLEQVNHKDGDKLNNKVSNLEWCTQSENMWHAAKLGLHSKRKDLVPLLPQLVTAINDGYYLKDIADKYGTTPKTLKALIDRHNPAPAKITNLAVGRRKSYIYFDKSRNKWRVELRKFKIPNRQFSTEKEAMAFVEYKLAKAKA